MQMQKKKKRRKIPSDRFGKARADAHTGVAPNESRSEELPESRFGSNGARSETRAFFASREKEAENCTLSEEAWLETASRRRRAKNVPLCIVAFSKSNFFFFLGQTSHFECRVEGGGEPWYEHLMTVARRRNLTEREKKSRVFFSFFWRRVASATRLWDPRETWFRSKPMRTESSPSTPRSTRMHFLPKARFSFSILF